MKQFALFLAMQMVKLDLPTFGYVLVTGDQAKMHKNTNRFLPEIHTYEHEMSACLGSFDPASADH